MTYGDRIAIKTRREAQRIREASRHVAEILLELRERVRPGMTTGDLDQYAARAIKERGVISSVLGYGPQGLPEYPAVLCTSVNQEVVHGIPGPCVLREGDILSLDFGVSVDGFHGDSAVTVPIGPVASDVSRLLEVTRDALYRGIEQMVPGSRLSDIGHAVESRVEPEGYSVVRTFAGHGIGRNLHEPPWIANWMIASSVPKTVVFQRFLLAMSRTLYI